MSTRRQASDGFHFDWKPSEIVIRITGRWSIQVTGGIVFAIVFGRLLLSLWH
jgi:hypothetical protein